MENKIVYRIQRRMYQNIERNEDFAAYDDIDQMNWELPWAAEPWVRKRVSAVGHNALKTVVNLFNTYRPKWEILPRGEADIDKAEQLERWLEWQMWQTNMKGAQEPFRKMLTNIAKKNIIAVQLDYLPYWLPDGEERKNLLLNGAFCINVYEPDNIHYEIGKYDLRWVAQVSCVSAAYLMDIWEQYESGDDTVAAALSKLRADVDESDEEVYYLYVDYTDKDKRWCAAIYSETETATAEDMAMFLRENADVIEFVNSKNELPFINWVICEATGDPLFKSIHESGIWENQNFFETLSDSTIIRRAYFPILRHTSPTGKPLDIDFTGPEAVVEDETGAQTEVLSPPPLDAGIRELQDRNAASMAQGLGVQGLQNTEVVGNVQFATVNAQIQLGKTILDPHIRAFEKACTHLAKMAFRWVQYMDDTVTSYRTNSKGAKKKGEKINISPKDYDPDALMITCELMANTPTDDMQRWNMFSGMLQVGIKIPQSEIVERMELGDPEHLEERFWNEKAKELAFEMFKQKKMGEMQMQLQQAAMAAQQPQPQQQPQGPQGMVPPQQGAGNPAFDQTQGQGFNPSQGGSSPYEAAPQMTQTQVQ